MEKGSSRWILISVVTFDAVVTFPLVVAFGNCFYLADDVIPWFLYDVIHPIQWQFYLQMLQLKAHQQSVLFEKLTRLPFCGTSIRTVAKHNLHGNGIGTTQHKRTKEQRKVQLMFIQRSQHSFIPILYSVSTTLSIPSISKMYHLTMWKSHRIKSILKKKCGHSPHNPQLTYLKEPTPVFPKCFYSWTIFGFEK